MSQEESSIFDEDVLRSFIWSVWNFFTISTEIEPEIGTPYLFDTFDHDDYTGVIGVSGSQQGAIYLSINQSLLQELMSKHYAKHLPENLSDAEAEEYRLDYIGELVNIISGNVRNYLGHDFLISIPIVIHAPKTALYLPKTGCGIIFPITWDGKSCHLILNLQADKSKASSDIQFSNLS